MNASFLYLTLKGSNPAYLSERKPFRCLVRPRKHLINRFFCAYSLMKRVILNLKLQKIYVKTGQKKSRY